MKQFHLLALALLMALLLPGCPFVSTVPLDSPIRGDVDQAVTGYWIWDNPKRTGESTLVSVLPFNDAEYLVQLLEADKGPSCYRAYRIFIADQPIWQINDVGAIPVAGYYFARLVVTPDGQLSIKFIDEKGVPRCLASDAKGLRAHLESHLSDTTLDAKDGPILWRRPRQGEMERGKLRSWKSRMPRSPGDLRVTLAANEHYDATKIAFQVELTTVGAIVWPSGDSKVYLFVDGMVRAPARWNFGELHDHVLPGPNGGVRLYVWMTESEVNEWLGFGHHTIVADFLGARSPALHVEVPEAGRITYDLEFKCDGWEVVR